MKYLAALFGTTLALGACAVPQTNKPAAAPGESTATAHGQVGPDSGPAKGQVHGMMQGQGMMDKAMMGSRNADHCPMGVEGTTVRVEETEGGAALVFSTSGDVAELRRRVTAMAEMHNKHPRNGCPMMGMHAKGMNAPSESSSTPADHGAHHSTADSKSQPTP